MIESLCDPQDPEAWPNKYKAYYEEQHRQAVAAKERYIKKLVDEARKEKGYAAPWAAYDGRYALSCERYGRMTKHGYEPGPVGYRPGVPQIKPHPRMTDSQRDKAIERLIATYSDAFVIGQLELI